MKRPRIRYFIEGNPKRKIFRKIKERVFAEVNAGFIKIVDGERKYARFKVSLEEVIKPDDFGYEHKNYKFERHVLEQYSYRTKDNSLLTKINRFDIDVINTFNYYESNFLQPSAEEFKKELLIRMGRIDRYKKETIAPSIKEVIAEVILEEENVLTSSKSKKSENTLKIYRTLLEYILRYEAAGRTIPRVDKFDKKAYLEFWRVQNDIVKGNISVNIKGKRRPTITPYGLLSSSANKYQKVMKTLFNVSKYKPPVDLDDESLIANKTSNRKDFYLNLSELRQILYSEPKSQNTRTAKDYIVIACLTGMRYESMNDAKREQIKEHKTNYGDFLYLHSRQNKTNTEAYIPLFKPVVDILEKHNLMFPKFPANALMNRYIKLLFKELEINRLVTIKIVPYIDNPIDDYQPISEKFSTHDCRKSAYTLLATHNVPENIIDLITHPSKPRGKMSSTYNKATLLDNAVTFYREVKERTEKFNEEVFMF